ncbi:hypothetical protein OFC17_32590, partial [Escherichia coli]|nr:hypothetical protein [Escherichia coli]
MNQNILPQAEYKLEASVRKAFAKPDAIALKGLLAVKALAIAHIVLPEKTGSPAIAKTGSHPSGRNFA